MKQHEEAAREIAQKFHETYERLAPSFGYVTKRETARDWEMVPQQNKSLMIATCAELIPFISKHLSSGWVKVTDRLPEDGTEVLVRRSVTKTTRPALVVDGAFSNLAKWPMPRMTDVTHWCHIPSPPE